jgi:transposase-like protein
MAKRRITRSTFTDEQRSHAVAQVDQYRASHGHETVPQAIKALGLPISKSNYNAWRLKLKNGALTPVSQESVTEFPLAAIPARVPAPARRVMTTRPLVKAHQDEDKLMAASLLEVAAKLLRRGA